ADLRAAWRLISRSVAAWRSRAASASRWAAREASRAALSACAAAFTSASAVSSAWRLAAGRACRRMRGRNEAVPSPDVTFGRYQPLAGLELRHQFRAAFPGYDADLLQAAGQFRRRLHTGGQRLDAGRQRGIVEIGAGHRPAHRRGGIDGRVEIVAEGSTQRLLKTLGDGDAVDDRRPEVLGRAGDEFRN